MTCSAIGKLSKFFRVIRRPGFMTVETPTHIHYLGILSNFNLGHIPMTVLTVQTCRNMRSMSKMHKIWHLRYRYPWNGFVTFDISHEFLRNFRELRIEG